MEQSECAGNNICEAEVTRFRPPISSEGAKGEGGGGRGKVVMEIN